MYFGKNKFNPNYQTTAEVKEWKALVSRARELGAICNCSPVWGDPENAPSWSALRTYIKQCEQQAQNSKAQDVTHLQGTNK